MDGRRGPARLAAGLIGLIAWGAVLAQLLLALETGMEKGTPPWMVAWNLFSYFTILSNSLVGLVTLHYALAQSDPRSDWKAGREAHWLAGSGMLAATALYIIVVGIIYQTILASQNNVTGFAKLVDTMLHGMVPIAYPLWWLAYGRSDRLRWWQALVWLEFPAIYCLYTLVRGDYLGRYPYPFIDVTKLGYETVGMNIAGLVVLFLLGSGIVIGIDNLLPRRNASY
jgi:hypothetical protein